MTPLLLRLVNDNVYINILIEASMVLSDYFVLQHRAQILFSSANFSSV